MLVGRASVPVIPESAVGGYPGSSSRWIKAFGRIHQKLCRICLTHLSEVFTINLSEHLEGRKWEQ